MRTELFNHALDTHDKDVRRFSLPLIQSGMTLSEHKVLTSALLKSFPINSCECCFVIIIVNITIQTFVYNFE